MLYGSEGTQALFTGLATQIVYGGCDLDTADFYSKASGTTTADLIPIRRKPTFASEGLSDYQAAQAVWIDWKCALGLPMGDLGFDASVLSEFRGRLIKTGLEYELLNRQLQILEAHRLLKSRGRQRTDTTHALAPVRHVNRLMNVPETILYALN